MKLIKIVSGFLCVLLAALPPHVMYAMSEDGNLWNAGLFSMMLAASVVSFAAFSASRFFIAARRKRIMVGILASYAAMIVLLIAGAVITGDLPETIMWMPIILIFGIPYMAPLVGITFLGSVLVFKNGKEKPEQNV